QLPGTVVSDVDTFMSFQIFDPVRDAAPCQIGRRSERASFVWTQFAGDQARIFRAANPDRHVDAFLYEVTDRIANPKVDRDSGVAFTEQSQVRSKHMQRDRTGSSEFDRPCRLSAHCCGDLLDLLGLTQEPNRP